MLPLRMKLFFVHSEHRMVHGTVWPGVLGAKIGHQVGGFRASAVLHLNSRTKVCLG